MARRRRESGETETPDEPRRRRGPCDPGHDRGRAPRDPGHAPPRGGALQPPAGLPGGVRDRPALDLGDPAGLVAVRERPGQRPPHPPLHPGHPDRVRARESGRSRRGTRGSRRRSRSRSAIGMGLTMDEAALLLDLEDVYWTRQGLLSVQVSLGVTATLAATILGLRMLRRGEEKGVEEGLIPAYVGRARDAGDRRASPRPLARGAGARPPRPSRSPGRGRGRRRRAGPGCRGGRRSPRGSRAPPPAGPAPGGTRRCRPRTRAAPRTRARRVWMIDWW